MLPGAQRRNFATTLLQTIVFKATAMTRLVTLLGLVVAFMVACGEAGDERQTYENDEFSYRFSYPVDWSIDIYRSPPSGDFVTQSTEVSNGDNFVVAFVNYQGGWCESGTARQETISRGGFEGTRYECLLPSEPERYHIVLYFEDVLGRMNYLITGQAVDTEEIETVREIIESFDFLD